MKNVGLLILYIYTSIIMSNQSRELYCVYQIKNISNILFDSNLNTCINKYQNLKLGSKIVIKTYKTSHRILILYEY